MHHDPISCQYTHTYWNIIWCNFITVWWVNLIIWSYENIHPILWNKVSSRYEKVIRKQNISNVIEISFLLFKTEHNLENHLTNFTITKLYPFHSSTQLLGQSGMSIAWLWIAIALVGDSQTPHLQNSNKQID